jgi:hypothetical protein
VRLLGLATTAAGVTPEPDRGIATVDEVDATVTLPLAEPELVGLKATLKLVDCPAPRETGRLIPVTLKAAPVAVTAKMVTLLPPVLVRVSDRVCVLPTVTLPKLRLPSFGASTPGVVPLPLKGMVFVGFFALDEIVTLPLVTPPVVGLKATPKLVRWPAANDIGRPIPLTLNPDPLAQTPEIVMTELPGFVTVMVCEFFVPTGTLPNDTLAGFETRELESVPNPFPCRVKFT